MPWNPTRFERFEGSLLTSTQTCRIVTDAGKAYVKPLGNKQGPHVLACELVGTALAEWFGLPTLAWAILPIDESDEIPLAPTGTALPGPAFATREEDGTVWGGATTELASVTNVEAISAMVAFDTWTLNCDRHTPDDLGRMPNPDNVFLASHEGGGVRILAIDHGHCFTCGRDLGPTIARIERVQDPHVYGLFPDFRPFVTPDSLESPVGRLKEVTEAMVREKVDQIPLEWQVDHSARAALVDLCVTRAQFVAEHIQDWVSVALAAPA